MNKVVTKAEDVNDKLKRQRKKAVVTALVLSAIALGIFVVFIGSAVLGR